VQWCAEISCFYYEWKNIMVLNSLISDTMIWKQFTTFIDLDVSFRHMASLLSLAEWLKHSRYI
jgi:hypothetical protein